MPAVPVGHRTRGDWHLLEPDSAWRSLAVGRPWWHPVGNGHALYFDRLIPARNTAGEEKSAPVRLLKVRYPLDGMAWTYWRYARRREASFTPPTVGELALTHDGCRAACARNTRQPAPARVQQSDNRESARVRETAPIRDPIERQ